MTGTAHGHEFWPGRPCHFMLPTGCSIYEKRPYDPCKTFRCEWLNNDFIPAWMKPDKVNVLISTQHERGKVFVELAESGSRMDPKVLSWFFMQFVEGKIDNIKYQIEGGWNYISRNDGDLSGEK